MRACEPTVDGYVEHDGVKIAYEVFGEGKPTLLLLPAWMIVHSRMWKLQVPYFARHYRVVTFDPPGNGRSDRPLDGDAYTVEAMAEYARLVLDATGSDQAILVALSQGLGWGVKLAADHPDRVLGAVFVGPSLAVEPLHVERTEAVGHFFDPAPTEPTGWDRVNANYWREQYDQFKGFFFHQCFTEPHSTKQHEDSVRWAGETTPELLLAQASGGNLDPDTLREWSTRVVAPTLVVYGDDDHVAPRARAETLAEDTGGDLVILEGAGHIPLTRDPVRANLLIREFVDRVVRPEPMPRQWVRGKSRPKRALYISSPIGLGHARRDLAVADELRRLHPDLEIEWLAQHPVTRVLDDAGEQVHPASAHLASESAHIESESGEHDLHCFQAWRRMDEILLADFMVFHDVVTSRDYDLVIGDEAWDVDYFLHENPELKRFAYCWFTDFVGWLPMPDGGEHEAYLTADYNAEMIEHIARYPRVRDRALFVGNPDDIVPDRFGPDLPAIRDWTADHYDFPGYITGFDPSVVADRDALRDELGYGPDERVCVVTVGGSGVGGDLLRRVADCYPIAADRVPGLRMLVVTGPRIDPASIPAPDGVDVRPFVPELYRHLGACDVALVQAGLTTCMELTATRRPFVYVPLRHHFEQNFHVHHRLQRHGAGRRVDFDEADLDALAEAIAVEAGRTVDYRPVETDGARRAAELIAEVL